MKFEKNKRSGRSSRLGLKTVKIVILAAALLFIQSAVNAQTALEQSKNDTRIINNGTGNSNSTETMKVEKSEKEISKPEESKKPLMVSKDVIKGKAKVLPKPLYPPLASTLRVSGTVKVQVMVDEKGKVISAKAISGHVTLKAVAERAARSAKFSPTFLNEQPIKVSQMIVYNFSFK